MLFSFRYICSLIENNHLSCLEKILIVVPGLNSLPGILKLHVRIITLQNGDKVCIFVVRSTRCKQS